MKEMRFETLRQKAEALLKAKEQDINIEEYKGDFIHLVEELSVHQIELELQNEQLIENEQKLIEEKTRFEDLYQNAPLGYVLFDKKGIVVEANENASQILNSSNHLKGTPFSVFLDGDNATLFFSHLRKVTGAQGTKDQTVEIQVKIKSKEKTLVLRSNVFQEKYCRTLIEDISEKKHVQEQVQKLNVRLEASMLAGDLAWWEMELPSGKVSFNENKTLMLDRDAKDFSHYTDFTNLLHPEDYENTMQAFQDHLQGNTERYDCEYRLRKADGSYVWFHDLGRIIANEDGKLRLAGIVSKIQDRKVAEERLIQANAELMNTNEELNAINDAIAYEREQFLSLLNSIPQQIYVIDIESSEILFANATLHENIGRNATGERCYEAIQGKSQKCNFCKTKLLKDNGEPLFWEYYNPYVKKYFYVMERIITWVDGRKVRFELSTDVTEMKEYEKALKDSEQRMQAIVKTLPDLLFHFDKNGKFLSFYQDNQFLLKQPEEFVNNYVEEVFDLEFAGQIRDCIQKALETGGATHKYTMQFNEPRSFSAKYSKLNDNEVIALVRDVTEQDKAKLAIKRSEERFKAFFVSSPTSIAISDQDGKYQLVNPAFSKFLGYSLKEIKGSLWESYSHPDSVTEEKQLFEKLIRKQELSIDFERRYRRKDGKWLWGLTHVARIISADGSVNFITQVINITESKKTREILREQKVELEEKNENILASVRYAGVIQSAIMPKAAELNAIFPDSFILNLPRDIVSGDFYWMKKAGNHMLLAVADCTGHGVPGALLSMLGISYLEDIVNRTGITENVSPGLILDMLRARVKAALKQSNNDTSSAVNKDGMDIALCLINIETKRMTFSGAHSPIFVINSSCDDCQVDVFKGNRMPISAFPFEAPFLDTHITLEKGDTVFLFSDGFRDQFGGKHGNKFSTKRFKDFFLKNKDQTMAETKELLVDTLYEWQGEWEQVDDILVLGFRCG